MAAGQISRRISQRGHGVDRAEGKEQRVACGTASCARTSATTVTKRMKTETDSIRSDERLIISNLQGRRTVSFSTNVSIDTAEAI